MLLVADIVVIPGLRFWNRAIRESVPLRSSLFKGEAALSSLVSIGSGLAATVLLSWRLLQCRPSPGARCDRQDEEQPFRQVVTSGKSKSGLSNDGLGYLHCPQWYTGVYNVGQSAAKFNVQKGPTCHKCAHLQTIVHELQRVALRLEPPFGSPMWTFSQVQ